MTFYEAFTDELDKIAGRGDQSTKLLSLLRIKGKNPYTTKAVSAIAKTTTPTGL